MALRRRTAVPVRERAQALLNVAAPEFREDLARPARELYGLRLSG